MPSRTTKMPNLIASALVTAGAALLTSAAAAQTPPQRLGLCAPCHGERGIASAKTIPNLAGQNLDYLRNALLQYQSGARDVAAMRAAAGMLKASELERVLQWYAAQPAGAPAAP